MVDDWKREWYDFQSKCDEFSKRGDLVKIEYDRECADFKESFKHELNDFRDECHREWKGVQTLFNPSAKKKHDNLTFFLF